MKKKTASITGIILGIFILHFILATGDQLEIADIEQVHKTDAKIDWQVVTDQATPLLQELIRIKTIRGDEHKASLWIQRVLKKEGIHSRIYRHPENPSRSNLVAELIPKKAGSNDGIILSSHTDVVEVEPGKWKQPPFSGALVDGKIWGRGAIDMKGHTIMQIMTMILIKRHKIPLKRKLMLLALADEETTNKYGARFMTSVHKDIFKGYKYVINEGGLGTIGVGPVIKGSKIFNVQFAEKGALWIKVKIKGESGHGARPPSAYALKNMVSFLQALQDFETDITITPEMETFFYQMGSVSNFPNSIFLKRAGNPLVKMILTPIIQKNRYLTAMTTNTRSLTALDTNENKGQNVIASEVFGKIDIRLLPGETTQGYLKKIQNLAQKFSIPNPDDPKKDFKLEIEIVDFIEPNSSPVDSQMMKVMSRVAMENSPGSIVTPLVTPGNTDNTHLRKLGLQCYGLTPVLLTSDELGSTHSDNEYISLENLKLGTKITFESVVGMN